MTAALYVLLFAPYFSLTRSEWAVLLLTIGLVMGVEAVNTAVEQTVNLVSPQRQEGARIAKDTAAGAVLLCAAAAIGVGIALFARQDVWLAILDDFRLHLWKPAALLLSVPAVLWFIITGGRLKKTRRPKDNH